MTINEVIVDNHLYDTIADMGLVMSPTKAIEVARKSRPIYRTLPLKDDDVNYMAYYGKHFMIHANERAGSEVWIGDEYIAEARMTWVPKNNDDYHVYGVVDETYPFDTELSFSYNENTIFRHSEFHPDDESVKNYTCTINESDVVGVDMYNACYYITQSRYFKPQIAYADGVYTITCPYVIDLDLFIVGNLVYCGNAEAGKGLVIDDVLETTVYTHIIVDHSDTYPVDARFYPWICVDKNAFIRVYKDTYTRIRDPFACRLINYPEFMEIEDPYNSDNEYLNNLVTSDLIIDPADTDEEMYEKFASMVGEWYRCFESYPYYRYDSAFCLHFNNEKHTEFTKETLILEDKTEIPVIISHCPFDINRDVIFYGNTMLDEYSTARLRKIPNDDRYEFALKTDNAAPVYVIDGELDPDKLVVIKFTPSGENTTIKNINYYLDKDHLLHLHHKIHKFYRNVALLQDAAFVIDELGEEVWVGQEFPSEMDERLWIELLTVADEDLLRVLANRIPDSVTGLLPESLLQKIAETPLTEEEISTEIHALHQEQDITIDDMEHHDIWIQWLDTIKDFVHFSKDNSIILCINEHTYFVDVEVDDKDLETVQILAFDDIVLNFRENKYADRYLSILADMYKSGIVTDKDMAMYYSRLITSADTCTPNLIRVFTYTSSVVTKMPRDKEDFCVVYSQNMGRIQLTMDHFEESEDRMKLAQCILPYKNIEDFAYLPERVMIYLNGKLINPNDIEEIVPYDLVIHNFDEIIETIDIMYNIIDIPLMKLRRLALDVLPASGENPTVTPSTKHMESIVVTGETRKGYYDVLYHDFTENEGLERRLAYYVEHPDEFDDFKKDLIETFNPITDKGGLHNYTGDNRIVLWGSLGVKKYVIGPKE